MLLSEDEVKIKSQLWFAENGEFLKERECKSLPEVVNTQSCVHLYVHLK